MGTFIRWLIATMAVILSLQLAVQWGGIFQGKVGWQSIVAWVVFWAALEFWHHTRNRISPV